MTWKEKIAEALRYIFKRPKLSMKMLRPPKGYSIKVCEACGYEQFSSNDERLCRHCGSKVHLALKGRRA